MAHRAFGIFAHITWHTRLRVRCIRKEDAREIIEVIHEAAAKSAVHLHEIAVLSDHVHVIASFRPELPITPFIRHAKSESSRRINSRRGRVFDWARGYYVESLSRSIVWRACAYVAGQFRRHPDRILE
jgi:REP element-mobilizing transposase RayT